MEIILTLAGSYAALCVWLYLDSKKAFILDEDSPF